MIKEVMAANIDVLYVELIPYMEAQRVNLFLALNQLRREGWDVPKVCPFLDPEISRSTGLRSRRIITYLISANQDSSMLISGN